MNIQDIKLTLEEIHSTMCISKGIVDTYDKDIVQVCTDSANQATLKALNVLKDNGIHIITNPKYKDHIKDDNGYQILLWSTWNKNLGIDHDRVNGYICFIPESLIKQLEVKE